MCLVGLAIGASSRFPVVIAANRDEFFERPSAPLGWWSAGRGDGLEVLGGRDLQAGGTWLGLTRAGRVALVTNVRELGGVPERAPSRGELVLRWLRGDASTLGDLSRYAGVNLLATDGTSGEWLYGGNRPTATRRLGPGVYGLSNATIDTPWPKVVALKARIAEGVGAAASATALRDAMYAALADDRVAADDLLPETGVGLAIERALSPAFVRIKERLYGTRSSSVVVEEAGVTHVWERSYGPDGEVTGEQYAFF